MTRVKTSICILLILIIFSIGSGIFINSKCSKLLGLAENARASAASGDYIEAGLYTEEFEECWEKLRPVAVIMIRSDRIYDISRISSRIPSLLDEESEELTAELDELKEMIYLLKTGELPLWTSIL
jgi:hypothetical protein